MKQRSAGGTITMQRDYASIDAAVEASTRELVHVAQYERFGSTAAFLRQYLGECFTVGYPNAPLGKEAVLRTKQIGEAVRR